MGSRSCFFPQWHAVGLVGLVVCGRRPGSVLKYADRVRAWIRHLRRGRQHQANEFGQNFEPSSPLPPLYLGRHDRCGWTRLLPRAHPAKRCQLVRQSSQNAILFSELCPFAAQGIRRQAGWRRIQKGGDVGLYSHEHVPTDGQPGTKQCTGRGPAIGASEHYYVG